MTRNALSIEGVGRKAKNVVLPHSIQARDNDCWSSKVIEQQLDQRLNSTAWIVGLASSQIDNSLSAWTVIKDWYRAEPWIVLHRWPIEPMGKWIQWVISSWNIGTDWSPIVIICWWFRLSHNWPLWWVLPMYRSSSINCDPLWQKQVEVIKEQKLA